MKATIEGVLCLVTFTTCHICRGQQEAIAPKMGKTLAHDRERVFLHIPSHNQLGYNLIVVSIPSIHSDNS